MDDVVLHYRPDPAVGLVSLLRRTETLLESFPCRTPPVFSPWFPAGSDPHPPIRPARPAPVISSWGGSTPSDSRTHSHTAAQRLHTPEEEEGPVSEGPHEGPPVGPHRPPSAPTQSPENYKDGRPRVPESPVRRSWSVFTQTRVLQGSASPSKRFLQVASERGLQRHQRVRWVVTRANCGGGRDIELVWRALTRSVRSSRRPTCNANIQRDKGEIWVYCDLVQSEQVGRFLKDELQLSGTISLLVHKLGNIYSM